MPGSGAGRFRVVGPPRLHALRVAARHHGIGHSAAALRTAELQILQRHITLAGVDDGLQIGGTSTARTPCNGPTSRATSSLMRDVSII
jgi:hypothetical protein